MPYVDDFLLSSEPWLERKASLRPASLTRCCELLEQVQTLDSVPSVMVVWFLRDSRSMEPKVFVSSCLWSLLKQLSFWWKSNFYSNSKTLSLLFFSKSKLFALKFELAYFFVSPNSFVDSSSIRLKEKLFSAKASNFGVMRRPMLCESSLKSRLKVSSSLTF